MRNQNQVNVGQASHSGQANPIKRKNSTSEEEDSSHSTSGQVGYWGIR